MNLLFRAAVLVCCAVTSVSAVTILLPLWTDGSAPAESHASMGSEAFTIPSLTNSGYNLPADEQIEMVLSYPVATAYGSKPETESAPEPPADVPEPCTLALCAGAGLLLTQRRHG